MEWQGRAGARERLPTLSRPPPPPAAQADIYSGINMGSEARNAMFAQYKHEVAQGQSQVAALKERGTQLREMKQSIKVCVCGGGGGGGGPTVGHSG